MHRSTGKSPVGIAKFIREYGYGHLTIVNSTMLTWGWEQTGLRDLRTGHFKASATYNDTFTIVKSHK